MKRYLAAALGSLVFAFETGCTVFGIRTFEQASYKVLSHDGKFEVREYAPVVVAETTVDADYEKAQSIAFRRLAGYIFGKNRTKEHIPMTAPVVQERLSEKIAMTAPVLEEKAEQGWRMTFVLPAKYTLQTLPEPVDPDVVLRQEPARRVAVIRYTGSLSEASMKTHTEELKKWMQCKGLRATSQPRLAGYDPPWTIPLLRRNEIQIDTD